MPSLVDALVSSVPVLCGWFGQDDCSHMGHFAWSSALKWELTSRDIAEILLKATKTPK